MDSELKKFYLSFRQKGLPADSSIRLARIRLREVRSRDILFSLQEEIKLSLFHVSRLAEHLERHLGDSDLPDDVRSLMSVKMSRSGLRILLKKVSSGAS